jgi:hypothetical protein
MDSVRLVGFGGGNGLAVMVAALLWPRNPWLLAHLITSASDDHCKSSTAALGQGFSHVGDVSRVLDALHEARFGDGWHLGKWASSIHRHPWMLQQSAIRYRSGIPRGTTFGEMYAEAFSPSFRKAVQFDPEGTLQSILHLMQIEEPSHEVLDLILQSFRYEFEKIDFKKHSFRNMRLYVLEKVARQMGGSPDIALQAAHALYGIPPEFSVEPVTHAGGTLIGETLSGKSIVGQGRIDFLYREPESFDPSDPIVQFRIEPNASASWSVLRAILEANAFLFAPGSPGGNLWALFSVEGMREVFAQAIRSHPSRHIPIVLVTNLMTEFGSTRFHEPWTAVNLFNEIHRATGQWPTHVIHDTTRYSGDSLAAHLPEVKIELGDWSTLPSWVPMPTLVTGEFSRPVPDDEFGSLEIRDIKKQKLIHDYIKLSPVLVDLFSPFSSETARALV